MADKNELIRIFEEIAALLEIKGDNPFKIRAYRSAAHMLDQLTADLDNFVAGGGLEETKGIGKALGEKIREFIGTGRVAYHDELKGSIPAVIFELMRLPGLGPKKALILHEKLAINSVGELEYACRENRLAELPGFGVKTQEKILESIQSLKRYQGRFILSDVWPLAEKIAEYLKSRAEVRRVEVAGDIRRRQETVANIDIVVSAGSEALSGIIGKMPGVEAVDNESVGQIKAILTNGIKLDVHMAGDDDFAAMLHYRTGSEEYLRNLRDYAKTKGFILDEAGLETTDRQKVVLDHENRLYHTLGLQFVEPELREEKQAIELAAAGKLPVLINENQLYGVFHVHTKYSDGGATIAEMAAAAGAKGWHYLGITDHSKSAVYAHGLKPETILKQRQEIDRLNAVNTDFRILAGIECDIMVDGSLDYPDDILRQFDFVIASVHSAFRLSEADMTRRIIKAMENRYVSMLGHSTGRILLAREGYALNLPAVLAAAVQTGTVIEINASPYRLDLDWRWCRTAKEMGVLLAINPDAHAVEELDYVAYGITAARKGWLAAADVVNTRPLAEALAILRRKH